MLYSDNNKRLTAEECLEHKLFKNIRNIKFEKIADFKINLEVDTPKFEICKMKNDQV